MSKKLLNKTTSHFLLFSVIILLVAAPLSYFLTEKLYIDETDETLLLGKDEFSKYFLPRFTGADIADWNKYNRNVKIMPSRNLRNERLFDTIYYDELENEQEPYRELNAPIMITGKSYTYVGRINLIEKEDLVLSIALLFLLIIIILLAGILIITKSLSKRLWKPFYETLGQIRDFEIDKSNTFHSAPTGTEEFDSLNKSIQRLIEKNTIIYKSQREFVEHAAHELQTPLALFQAKIDTLIQFPDISQGQSALLGALNDDIARFNRLNKNLLLLSKIENDSYFEKQLVVLDDFIYKNLDFFTEQARSKNISIITEFKERLTIESNPGLIEILVNNLFLNAIRHNNPDGEIIITISGNTLSFRNTGQNNALAGDKLFNRFSKSNPSGQGNGLGLAIVKKIVELNDWEIDYSFQNNLHTFTVLFTQ